MIWQLWHHYFYSVRGNCKLCFQAVDTPGGRRLVHYITSEKNIWLLFDVDKLPGAPKTKLVSLALSLFSSGDSQPQNLFRGESRRDGLQVIAPSSEGMDVGGVIGSTAAEREREQRGKKNESESAPPPPCKSQQPAVSQPPKPLGLFFPPLYPIKEVRLWNTT